MLDCMADAASGKDKLEVGDIDQVRRQAELQREQADRIISHVAAMDRANKHTARLTDEPQKTEATDGPRNLEGPRTAGT